VRTAVLDASVVLKWLRPEREPDAGKARALQREYEAGRLLVLVPPLLVLELLNVAARRWKLGEERLVELAETLEQSSFERVDPDPVAVARWAARGLTAYDAVYVAVAEQTGATLVTADAEILARAPGVAEPLG
jgi:predicted nucleic acid-binding protein